MAKLGKPYPMPKLEDYPGDPRAWFEAQNKALNEIPIDRLVTFPVADGQACYYVSCLRPLVLRHIHYLDGYEISDAHLRGLRINDVQLIIIQKKALRELFS